MSLNIDQLKSSYIDWMKNSISISELENGVVEITSPFLDRHNDHLQIYAIPSGDIIKLTDDGYILNDLYLNGCDIDRTIKRKEIFSTIANGFGVQRLNNELYIEATMNNFPQKKHMLLQAMLSINDMFMTSSINVRSIFLEEVEDLFIKHDIRYSPQVSFIGKSGLTHTYEFLITPSRNAPERLIKTVNNPDLNITKSILFAWGEVREERKSGTQLYTFLNDRNRKISNDIFDSLNEYGVKAVPWSQRMGFIPELSA